MTAALQNAIEGIYLAFADVAKPAAVEGCPCCMNEAQLNVLVSKPLRELTPSDLTKYASKVLLTVGSPEDFVYFIPRILEIRASERYWWPDVEVIARAISEGGFDSWPDSRRNAIMAYFDQRFADLLHAKDGGNDLDSWICSLGHMHVDLSPYLARIAANTPRLIEYYEENSKQLVKGHLSNSFWDGAPDAERRVLEWFQSDETKKAIQAAYGLG